MASRELVVKGLESRVVSARIIIHKAKCVDAFIICVMDS